MINIKEGRIVFYVILFFDFYFYKMMMVINIGMCIRLYGVWISIFFIVYIDIIRFSVSLDRL